MNTNIFGKPIIIEQFIKERRDICNSCEHLKTFVGAKFCESCGCSIWAKTQLKNTKCPEGKWDAQPN